MSVHQNLGIISEIKNVQKCNDCSLLYSLYSIYTIKSYEIKAFEEDIYIRMKELIQKTFEGLKDLKINK